MNISKLALTALLPAMLVASLPLSARTKQVQATTTPDAAIQRLKDGNARFVKGKLLNRDLRKQVRETSSGQYPFATVLSCMDSRTSSELLFDQGIGDIFNARLAGNIASDEVLGSLEFASKVAGSKLIAVIGHTSCGAIKGAVDDVKLGHLDSVLREIKPAVETTRASHPEPPQALVDEVAAANVKHVIGVIREKSPILREMLEKGEIAIVGGMYDLKTGKVAFYEKASL
jgi:carbonic anhydrase